MAGANAALVVVTDAAEAAAAATGAGDVRKECGGEKVRAKKGSGDGGREAGELLRRRSALVSSLIMCKVPLGGGDWGRAPAGPPCSGDEPVCTDGGDETQSARSSLCSACTDS